uniref:Uncharacterized protein n=1 Tax=Anguilla anguilla TaxID=7936 RepID=A0A0E9R0W7_ANGAN
MSHVVFTALKHHLKTAFLFFKTKIKMLIGVSEMAC